MPLLSNVQVTSVLAPIQGPPGPVRSMRTLYFVTGFTIPATTTAQTTGTVSDSDMLLINNSVVGTLAYPGGTVPGTLSRAANGSYSFTRTTAGSAITLSANTAQFIAAQGDNLFFILTNIAALRTSSMTSGRFYVLGHTNTSDGGEGYFYCDSADTTSSDNNGTVIINAAGKRFKRIFAGVLNVRWFGARGDGTTDDQTALAATLALGDATETSVFVPSGVYAHSNILSVNGIRFFGDGPDSVLKATNPQNAAIKMTGSGTEVTNLHTISPNTSARLGDWSSAAVWVASPCNKFRIGNCTMDDPASNAVLVNIGANDMVNNLAPKDGLIEHNLMNNTWADAIHLVDGANHINVLNNVIYNPGDDMVAVVTYRNASKVPNINQLQRSSYINIIGNMGREQTLGRGISVIGGEHVNIANNNLEDTWGSGIYLCAEEGADFTLVNVRYVNVVGNTMRNVGRVAAGGDNTYLPAIYISGSANYITEYINVEANIIEDANWHGILVQTNAEHVSLHNNMLRDVNGYGIWFQNNVGNITCSDNMINHTYSGGIYSETSQVFGRMIITGNSLKNINYSNGTGLPNCVIGIADSGNITSLIVENNHHSNDAGYTFPRLVDVTYNKNGIIVNNTTGGTPLYDVNPGTTPRAFRDKQRVHYFNLAPTGADAWLQGDIVFNRAPTAAKNISHWSCVASGSPGTWVAHGCGTGTTAQRPAMAAGDKGFMYRDTTTGTLLFWDGANWI